VDNTCTLVDFRRRRPPPAPTDEVGPQAPQTTGRPTVRHRTTPPRSASR